jgi:hypothetical protein
MSALISVFTGALTISGPPDKIENELIPRMDEVAHKLGVIDLSAFRIQPCPGDWREKEDL